MENSIRQERLQEQQQKDISSIHTEVESLKVTLIGIDGNNGMRSQISNLTLEITDLKKCFNKLIQGVFNINSDNSKNDLVFSTKKELRETEKRITGKIEDLQKNYKEERKEREDDKEERKKHLDNLKTSRWILLASILGILTSSIITYLN